MIPKLYESNETAFKTNGLGSLSDALSCVVTEERNGVYELEMEYPVGGLHYDLIETNRIIYAKPSETSDPQPFDIKEVTLSMDGMKATIYAQHIRYRLNGIPVKPFKATGITNALQGLIDNAMINQGFTVWTDINNGTSVFTLEEPNTFGQLLGGTDGSILDVFSGSSGCEYEFDKKNIKLWAHRGSDNGVSIRYGKNLKGCKMETNIESVYTGVLAYWNKEEDGETKQVIGDIQYIDTHANYPRETIYLLDCSSDYDSEPSASDLNSKAKSYGTNNKIGEPSVSADIEFYQLWQTEEYKDVAPLERVSLCDTVHVLFKKLGCDVSAIVNETVYDVLLERYNSITIGSAKSKLGETVKQTAHSEAETVKKETVSVVQDSINKAVDKIRGGTNGHVVLAKNANGETNEIYAYVGDSLESASKVLRTNYEGIAGTDEGLNGTYKVAITTDGKINADQITFGQMDGGLIKANTIVIGSLSEDVQTDISDAKEGAEKANNSIIDLQKQIDGVIETWTGDAVPTLTNYPASSWTSDEDKEKHIGDLYYDANNHAYRFMQNEDGTFQWKLLADSDVTKAVQDAKEALDGVNGSVASLTTQYYASTSATELKGGSWSDEQPSWTEGNYIWFRTKTTTKAGIVSYSTPSCIQGNTGAQGEKGDQGEQGEQGAQGEKGDTGSTGNGIESSEVTYQASASGTTAPTGDWSSEVPSVTADMPYVWTKFVVTYTDGTSTTSYSVGCTPEGWIAETNKINASVATNKNGIANITQKQETLEDKISKAQSSADSASETANEAVAQYEAQQQRLNSFIDEINNGVGKTVSEYLGNVVVADSDGIKVLASKDSTSYIHITNDGISLYYGGQKLAYFGSTTDIPNLIVRQLIAFGAHSVDKLTLNGEVGTGFTWIG